MRKFNLYLEPYRMGGRSYPQLDEQIVGRLTWKPPVRVYPRPNRGLFHDSSYLGWHLMQIPSGYMGDGQISNGGSHKAYQGVSMISQQGRYLAFYQS